MKRLLLLVIAVTLVACKGEPKDYVTLSGKIANPDESKTLKIFKGKSYEKIINLNDDGTFKDTLKVVEGDYNFQHGKEYGTIFLKNDNTSEFETDYNTFIDSMIFKGDGADTNNFSLQSFVLGKDHFNETLVSRGSKEEVEQALENYKSAYQDLKTKYPSVDSTHIAIMDKNINRTVQQINQFVSSKFAVISALPKGTPSPTFENYENYSGGNLSLSDLKGKYIYIDIWATWCPPCIREIPSLKKLEKQYHGKNIEFVSISVDNGRGYKNDAAAAYQGWKKMVADKELTGIQLFADNGFQSDFIKNYKISGIPRFILIDPAGNIVNADAPRPSNRSLIELFDDLGI
ncbi:TlpA family protein disulfide reductase [Winogradskyella eckloniae]|uniref:TlpA family protein disulfide reductase n=1 Tax=Winogradskyella eckloniae TaxID=1089306 RepID=UPI0015644D9D|nr:TlpA disulfide reductase family protein [Winogradskyella eckloniae]NRD20264.1 TlpA family protein disulfide reductase [Winogradskyella eckloniae]